MRRKGKSKVLSSSAKRGDSEDEVLKARPVTAAKETLLRWLGSSPKSWINPGDPSFGVFLAVLIGAVFTRYYMISYPPEVVFDEVHFGGFTDSYLRREYFFDIHPPLGKLILWATAKIARPEYNGYFNYSGDRRMYDDPNVPWLALRIAPATSNAVLCVVMYALARQMGLSLPVAAFVGAAVIFESAILLQCKLILIDSFLLTFVGIAMLCSFRLARYGTVLPVDWGPVPRGHYAFWLVLTGIFAGCAASVKWTALAAVGGILVQHGLIGLIMVIQSPMKIPHFAVRGASILLIGLSVYLVIQYMHFALLLKTGEGIEFHTSEFRITFQGEKRPYGVRPLGFIGRVLELTEVMFVSNKNILEPHPYQSRFWGWPINHGGLFYWQWEEGSDPAELPQDTKAEQLVLGNPILYWSTFFTLFIIYPIYFCVITVQLLRKAFGWSTPEEDGVEDDTDDSETDSLETHLRFLFTTVVLCITYAGNMLPYIGVLRSTYLYHYFPPLLVAILIMALVIEHGMRKKPYAKLGLCVILIVALAWMFYFLSPLVYGTPLTDEQRARRMDNFYIVGGPEQPFFPWQDPTTPPTPEPEEEFVEDSPENVHVYDTYFE